MEVVRKQVPITKGPTREDLVKSYELRDDRDPFYVHVYTEKLLYPLRIGTLVEEVGEGFYFAGFFDDGGVAVQGLWNPETKKGYVMVY